MITLYHLNYEKNPQLACDIRFENDLEKILVAYKSGNYDAVALIWNRDLDFAFKATQNGVLSETWSQEPPKDVFPKTPFYHLIGNRRYGRRSTDIGDIMELEGKLYVVAMIGFTKLPMNI